MNSPRADDAVQLDRGTLGLAPDGRVDADAVARTLDLAAVFGRELVRGVARSLLLAAALLPAAGLLLYIAVRSRVEQFAVAPDEVAAFALETMRLASRGGAVWAAFAAAVVGAGQVPRDLRAGALLLYFTRPVERTDYLLGRTVATSGWLAAGLIVPVCLVWVGLIWGVGLRPEGIGSANPWLLWPGLLAVGLANALLQACLLALTALGIGAWLRHPTGALLTIVGAVGGSAIAAHVFLALWGRESLVGALDLHASLSAPFTLLSRPFEPVVPPPVATLEAALGLGLWFGVAALGWFAFARTLRDAPLGRGRS